MNKIKYADLNDRQKEKIFIISVILQQVCELSSPTE